MVYASRSAFFADCPRAVSARGDLGIADVLDRSRAINDDIEFVAGRNDSSTASVDFDPNVLALESLTLIVSRTFDYQFHAVRTAGGRDITGTGHLDLHRTGIEAL